MGQRYLTATVICVLLLAAALRVWGITYGLPCAYCRPDEDRLLGIALKLSGKDPNPHYFIWPSLFFYLSRGVLEIARTAGVIGRAGSSSSWWGIYLADPLPFHLILRFLFCASGVATVYFLFRLGEKMFSGRSGMLAAFFLALSFLHARDSHFAMLDIPVTLFAVMAALKAWDVYRRGGRRDYLLCGFWCGLGLATKYYAGMLVFLLVVAHLSRRFSAPPERGGGLRLVPAGSPPRLLAPRFLMALGLAAVIFMVTSPFLFLDFKAAAKEIRGGILASQFVTGFGLVPHLKTARGWLYHLTFSLRYGLGLPLELASLLGVGYGLYRAVRGEVNYRLLLAFLLPFYVLLSFQKSCFLRYTTMLLPFLCLFAGEMVVRVSSLSRLPALALLLSAVLVSDSAYRIIRLDALLSCPDTRLLSSIWMEKTLPLTSGLLFPRSLIFGRPWASASYLNRMALPGGDDPAAEMAARSFIHNRWFFILDEHPLEYSYTAPGVKALISENSDLIYQMNPFRSAAAPVYDPFDAFYVPLDGFERVSLPGPAISIYWLR